jgi:hypothetical protein
MSWAVSIAVFLGTVIAVMAAFWLYSHRDEIRAALKERRRESRTSTEVCVEISSLDDPPVRETALTENVSRHGARIVTRNRWRPTVRVLVRLSRRQESYHAWIAYCSLLRGDEFAVGLRFSRPVDTSKFLEYSFNSNWE